MRRSGGLTGFRPPRLAGVAAGPNVTSGSDTVLKDTTNLPSVSLSVSLKKSGTSGSAIATLRDEGEEYRLSTSIPREIGSCAQTEGRCDDGAGGNVNDLFDGEDDLSIAQDHEISSVPTLRGTTISKQTCSSLIAPGAVPNRPSSFIRPSCTSSATGNHLRPLVKPTAVGSSSATTVTTSSQLPRAFNVMYTKKSSKKRKSFSDGVAVIRDGKLVLYDSEGKQVSQTRIRMNDETNRLGAGSQVDCGTQEIEISSVMDFDFFLSGKAFLSQVPMKTEPVRMQKLPRFSSLTSSSSSTALTKRASGVKSSAMFDSTTENALVLVRGDETKGTCDIVVDPCLSKRLRPHQREGVQFMFECVTGARLKEFQGHGCVLADEMGLGKSLQAITLIWTMLKQGPVRGGHPFARKAVIVCPASLVDNWCREVAKFLGPAKLRPIGVTEAGIEAEKAVEEFITSRVRPLLIISYETYRKHSDRLNNRCPGFELLVCDEGHRLKSSQGNKTIEALSAAPTLRRVILTGTPLQNQLDEFYAVISFVNPQVLGRDSKHFKRVFQVPIEKGRDKTASKEDRDTADARSKELQRLTKAFVLRRTSEVNRALLPLKRETTVFLRMSLEEQTRLYLEMIQSKHVQNLLGGANGGNNAEALRLVMRLKQICTHPLLVSTSPGEGICSSIGLKELLETSGKFQFIDALLKETRAEDITNRIVLVSTSTAVLDLLARLCDLRKYNYLRLDGSTKVKDRQRLVNRFNAPVVGPSKDSSEVSSSSSPFVFLLSSKAGGCGLNLIGANRLVLVDPDWNPAVDSQAMARVWRDGQTKPVVIYRLLMTGTIEERVFQRQLMKAYTAGGILTGGDSSSSSLDQSFSRAELKKLFEFRQDTRCDTYEMLLTRDDEHRAMTRNVWAEFKGPDDVVGDAVLKRVLIQSTTTNDDQEVELISWIQSELFDGSSDVAPLTDDSVATVGSNVLEGDAGRRLYEEEEALFDDNDQEEQMLEELLDSNEDDDQEEQTGEGLLASDEDDDDQEEQMGEELLDSDDDQEVEPSGNEENANQLLNEDDDSSNEKEELLSPVATKRRRRLVVEDDDDDDEDSEQPTGDV